jgi:PBSX family phage terminase large subunit
MAGGGDPLKIKPDRVTLNYKVASDKHLAFHEAWRIPTRIVNGGVGTGKTVMVAFDIINHLTANPIFRGKTAIVVGLTGTHIRDQLLPEFLKIMRNEFRKRNTGFVEGRHYKISRAPTLKIEFNINGATSTILFMSLESRDSLRGFNASIVYCDDLGSTDSEAWDIVCDRAFREEDGVGMMIATCNPGAPSHWLYRRYMEAWYDSGKTLLPDKVYLDSFEMWDNPFLQKRWPIMEARYKHDPVEYARKIRGEWRGRDGLVYSNFNRDIHVMRRTNRFMMRDDLPFIKDSVINVGIDFGGRDATAVLWVAKHEDKFYVFKEYYSTNRNATISDHAKFINKQPYHVLNYYSDHYTETVNTYRQHGLHLHLADKGPGSVVNGIALINQLFAENRLFITDDCENTIKELESYEWNDKGQDKPKDTNNHAMDALRYVLFEIGQQKHVGFEAIFHTALPSHTLLEDKKTLPVVETVYLKDVAAAPSGAILVGYEPKTGKPIYAKG